MFRRTILAALLLSLALTAHDEPQQDQAAHVHTRRSSKARRERSNACTHARQQAKALAVAQVT